jgi:hypothetical protein
MLVLLPAVLIPVLAGFLLLRALWPPSSSPWNRWDAGDWLRLPAGVFAGLGLTSIPVMLVPATQHPLLMDAGILGLSAFLFVLRLNRRGAASTEPTGPSWTWTPASWITGATGVIVAIGFYLTTRTNPHGDFDAWRIWNFRPRFLFRGQTLATLGDPLLSWTHPEFPHLITGAVLRLWRWMGEESQLAPMALAGLFTLFAPMALYGVVRLLRTPAQGLLAVAALLGSTLYFTAGSTQLADVPMSAYLLASLSCVLCGRSNGGLAFAAGLLAGLAAWLKFEGAFYAAALAGLALWQLGVAGLLRFALGALPGVAVTAYFLKSTASATAVSAHPMNLLAAIAGRMLDWTYMGWAVMPFLVFALYAWCVGFTSSPKTTWRDCWAPSLAVFLAGCVAVMVRDDNSGDTAGIRLVLHAWPLLLLALFRHTKAPEELAVAPAPGPQSQSRKSRK